MLYVENSKLAARKLLEIINEFGKVAGYKLIYRNPAFLHTHKKYHKKKVKK